MIHWKPIVEYVEPNWVKLGTDLPPALFWRPKKGASLGYIRDGELFDANGSIFVIQTRFRIFPQSTHPITIS
jgi:hypothetical protein